MTASTRRLLAAALAAVTLFAGSACSSESGDTTVIRQELDAQARAQQSLRDRIDGLQSTLDQLTDIEQGQAADFTTSVEERLTALDDAMTALQDALTALETLHGDDTVTTNAALGDLDSRIIDVNDTLAALEQAFAVLQREVQDLKEDHDLLRAQFERHVENHS